MCNDLSSCALCIVAIFVGFKNECASSIYLLVYLSGKLKETKAAKNGVDDGVDDGDDQVEVDSDSGMSMSVEASSTFLLNRVLTQDVLAWLARGSDGSDNSSNGKTSFHLAGVDKRLMSRSPAPAFTTSSLQQEASKRLGLSPSLTMRLAQVQLRGRM